MKRATEKIKYIWNKILCLAFYTHYYLKQKVHCYFFSAFILEDRLWEITQNSIFTFKVDHPFFFAILYNHDIMFTGRFIGVL